MVADLLWLLDPCRVCYREDIETIGARAAATKPRVTGSIPVTAFNNLSGSGIVGGER